MNVSHVLTFVIVAACCGAMGEALVGASGKGFLRSTALGLIGAWVGPALARFLKLPSLGVYRIGGTNFPLGWTVLGAALVVTFAGTLSKKEDPEASAKEE